ncbi:MAG: hypothetical protein LC128_11155 [Chitinophagales bacterium]|nr:hypothetical protein [Chitinophagales bacterium]
MQRSFDNNDFEKFVQQNADQYRMYPSEKVWKGIHSTLHTKWKWYGLGFALLMISSAVVTWMLVTPPKVTQQSHYLINNPELNNSINRSVNRNSQEIKQPNNSTSYILSSNSPLLSVKKKALKEEDAIFNENSDHLLKQPSLTKPITQNIDFNQINISEVSLTTNNTEVSLNPVTSGKVNEGTDPVQKTENSFEDFALPDTGEELIAPGSDNTTTLPEKSAMKNRKLKWQIFITPTVSYRRLSENKSYLQNNSYASSNYSYAYLYDVNNVVTHKPDMGFEIGVNTGYHVTKNIKIRAGIQFNINRYGIKAYSYNNEVATIALNSTSSSGRRDSLNEVARYRNFNGYNSGWLQNFYFSASAPIGIEYNLKGSSKTNFGIAGTIQPTYIISDKAYLISTDYKNYLEVPWLVRRWNMNTGLELFVNYSTNKMDWQLGPQIRYQLLSSFQSQYPVKENLFDFGFKVGVSLNK